MSKEQTHSLDPLVWAFF